MHQMLIFAHLNSFSWRLYPPSQRFVASGIREVTDDQCGGASIACNVNVSWPAE
jgi:hypothetical protein